MRIAEVRCGSLALSDVRKVARSSLLFFMVLQEKNLLKVQQGSMWFDRIPLRSTKFYKVRPGHVRRSARCQKVFYKVSQQVQVREGSDRLQ